jgi:SAM-dependent methyltransferase
MDIGSTSTIDVGKLRTSIQREYQAVATDPSQGFHFHTGRPLARMLNYKDEWLEGLPARSVDSFAGTGNPFLPGPAETGGHVVDVGCGSGLDSLIAARMVGIEGGVIGVDMTPEMLSNARRSKEDLGLEQLSLEEGYAESLPVQDGWADLLISNGVLNLSPNKTAVVDEWARVVKPGGRLQIGDIIVQKVLPQSAKDDISLWTG